MYTGYMQTHSVLHAGLEHPWIWVSPGGLGISPMRILRMQHILGQTLGARLEPSRFLAVLLTQRTDMFSHEAYMLLKEDHEHCVQMSAVNAFKGQSDGFARMGCVIYSVDRQGVTED